MSQLPRSPPVAPQAGHAQTVPMKRPPEDPGMEEWVDKHKHVLMGLVLDGMCVSTEHRARKCLILPGLIERRLREAYMEVIMRKEPPNGSNGVKK